MMTRMFGVPVAAGILVAALLRRAWRAVAVLSACLTPFLGALAWRVVFPRVPEPPIPQAAAASLGWTQTWVYYTNYLTFWRMSVPNAHILWAMLKNNSGMLLRGPADYFLALTLTHNTSMGRVLMTLVTATALMGIVRQARSQEWQPIHYSLPLYSAVIVLWNFPDVDRFLLPFLPLLAAGVWIEGRHVLGMIRVALTRSGHTSEKIVATALGIGIVALGSLVGLNYVAGVREVGKQSADRGTLLQDKREAYDWFVQSVPTDARIIAYEDSSNYLYTGRTSMPPLALTTAEFYEVERLEKSLTHMSDVAKAMGAKYWLFSDDDFDFVWPDATAKARTCLASIELALPILFRSRNGGVRIHAFSPIQRPEELACGPQSGRGN